MVDIAENLEVLKVFLDATEFKRFLNFYWL